MQRQNKESQDAMTDLIDQLNAIEAKNKKEEEDKQGIKINPGAVNLNQLALTQLEKDRAIAEADFSKFDTSVNGDELVSLKSMKKRKHPKKERQLLSTKETSFTQLKREDFQISFDDENLVLLKGDEVDADDLEMDE